MKSFAISKPIAPARAMQLAGDTGNRRAANLTPWFNKPVVQDAVIGFLMNAEYPMLLVSADGTRH